MSLPSSMADFVPRDCLLQKAYCLLPMQLHNYTQHKQSQNGSLNYLAPVALRVDSAIRWINHSSLDNSIDFASVYSLDSNLSGG